MYSSVCRISRHVVAVATTLGLGATAAIAQVWIGPVIGELTANAKERECLSGAALPPSEIAEARIPSNQTMQLYWKLASAADTADVRPAYQARGKGEWISLGRSRRDNGLAGVNDSVARRSGAQIASEPIAFVRARDGKTARGYWRTANFIDEGDDKFLKNSNGFYLADFRRSAGAWKLTRLELLFDASEAPKISQYCHTPGDVEIYKAKQEEVRSRKIAKDAARARSQ